MNTIKNFIESLYWVFTHKCNNTCAHCYNESGPQGEIISKSEIDKIIENLSPFTFRRMILSGGEPFYAENKDILFYLLEKLREKYPLKTGLCIQTNGDFLTEEIIDDLKRFNVQRLDISSFDIYHKHMDCNNMDEKKEKVEKLFKSKNIPKFKISPSNLTPTKMGILGVFEKIRDFIEKIGLKRKKGKMVYAFWGATDEIWLKGNWARGRALKNGYAKLDPNWNFCNIWSGAKNFLKMGSGKQELKLDLYNLYPCCPKMIISLGDLRQESLIEILNRIKKEPEFQALNKGKPELMGKKLGITKSFALNRIKELRDYCLWCDEFFIKYFNK